VETAVILLQACEAVEAAHAQGIIHRDLKPENIMVFADAADPSMERIKVLDFGIRQQTSPTPRDQPDHGAGRHITWPRAVGGVMRVRHLVSGRHPLRALDRAAAFFRENLASICMRVVCEAPAADRAGARATGRAERIIMRCLEKNLGCVTKASPSWPGARFSGGPTALDCARRAGRMLLGSRASPEISRPSRASTTTPVCHSGLARRGDHQRPRDPSLKARNAVTAPRWGRRPPVVGCLEVSDAASLGPARRSSRGKEAPVGIRDAARHPSSGQDGQMPLPEVGEWMTCSVWRQITATRPGEPRGAPQPVPRAPRPRSRAPALSAEVPVGEKL
jgi:hypothetical protein